MYFMVDSAVVGFDKPDPRISATRRRLPAIIDQAGRKSTLTRWTE
jgi:hypothetical protein